MKSFIFTSLLSLAGLVSGHMEIKNPAPLRSKFNSFTTDIDWSMTNPLSGGGGDYPCKGYHNLMGTPQGRSVTTYVPGNTYQMTITGGTPHNGGSCQASLSYDRGRTFTVIHSYIGNCPIGAGDSNYAFRVPADAPSGEALFAWSWFNQIGNREMYMNCAVVTIGRGRAQARRDEVKRASFSSRPAMFRANTNNGCTVPEGVDVVFPRPGPDVTRNGGKPGPPTGNC